MRFIKTHLPLICLFLGIISCCKAQNNTGQKSISLRYFGHVFYLPGINASVFLPISSSSRVSSISNSRKYPSKTKTLFIQPSLGYYAWSGYNSNYFLGASFGMKQQRADKKSYSIFNIGLNYRFRSDIIATTVNLKGEIVDRTRKSSLAAIPTIGYFLGRDVNDKWGCITGMNVGIQRPLQDTRAFTAYFELGLNYNLN